MKLRERITICFCITCVLFTLLLLIDLQFDIGYSRNRLGPLVPLVAPSSRHGRVGFEEMPPDGDRSIYRKFQDRFGFAPSYVDEGVEGAPTANVTGHDPFADLMGCVGYGATKGEAWRNVVIGLDEDRKMAPTVGDLVNVAFNE